MAQERYFIGPQLLGEIRNTIQRVDALSPGAARPGRAVHQSLQQPVATVAQNFRIATFTGAWSIGSSKTVTFKYQTATPNTVSATNLFCGLSHSTSVTACDVSVAKEGTAWFLVQPNLTQLPGYSASGTQVLTVVNGNLRFVGTTAC